MKELIVMEQLRKRGEFCPEAFKSLKHREGLRHRWMSDSLMKEA